MEGALLIGLEIAIFFAGVYAMEYRKISALRKEAKRKEREEGIIITHNNVEKFPVVFAIELKKMLDNSKDGAIMIGNTELLEALRSYQQHFPAEGGLEEKPDPAGILKDSAKGEN
jgi:hypothetical protein